MTVGVDGHAAEQLAELLIAAHSQLKVAGHDTRLLVVAGRVAGELEDRRAQVLRNRREVPFARLVLDRMLRRCMALSPVSPLFEWQHFVDRSALFHQQLCRHRDIVTAKQNIES